jgi:branched-chain amino acid transport system permease protein
LNTTIMLFLVQDGITNGAIYALLGLALVLCLPSRRVILIPQGEFVTFGALSYAVLATGKVPGTALAGDGDGPGRLCASICLTRGDRCGSSGFALACPQHRSSAAILALAYGLAGPKDPDRGQHRAVAA